MKYRIVKETSGDNIKYFIERKFWFFWHSVDHIVFDYVLTFETVQEAEEYVKKLIKCSKRISTTQTIVKEISDHES